MDHSKKLEHKNITDEIIDVKTFNNFLMLIGQVLLEVRYAFIYLCMLSKSDESMELSQPYLRMCAILFNMPLNIVLTLNLKMRRLLPCFKQRLGSVKVSPESVE
jgi:hypothetical protein